MRHRRLAWWLAGGLGAAAVLFVAASLIWPDSRIGRLLSGAGVDDQEPTIFPAEHVAPAVAPLDMQALESGQPGTTVTFGGLLNGWCKAYGTDAAHPAGVEYYAGTLRLQIEGQEHAAYCIDLERTLETGDSYEAIVRVPAADDLCPVYWILENYGHDRPAEGLLGREEGAAIQAAIWYYVDGFQPQWDPGCWCYKQAVLNRALDIIQAASGQCATLPDMLSLSVEPEVVPVGEAAELVATLTDRAGQPLAGRRVTFRAETGELSAAGGTTGEQGQAGSQVRSAAAGTGRVTAIAPGTFPFGAVLPVDAWRQPVLIQNPTGYYALDTRRVTWVEGAPGVEVQSFAATLWGDTAHVEWRTTREVAVRGFNLYHRANDSAQWAQLNDDPISSLGRNGGLYEWTHAAIDPAATHVYLLETVGGLPGEQFGPVVAARRVFLPLCSR